MTKRLKAKDLTASQKAFIAIYTDPEHECCGRFSASKTAAKLNDDRPKAVILDELRDFIKNGLEAELFDALPQVTKNYISLVKNPAVPNADKQAKIFSDFMNRAGMSAKEDEVAKASSPVAILPPKDAKKITVTIED